MATDKPRGAVRRAAPKAPDPRVDDLSTEPPRHRTRVPRPQQPENPLDRIAAFESGGRPAPGVPPIVAAERADVDHAPDDTSSTVLLAPPPPPAAVVFDEAVTRGEPATIEEPATVAQPATVGEPATVEVALPAPQPAAAPPRPRSTDVYPATDSASRAAALLELGGRDGDREPDPATIDRVLAPLARLRPAHRPVVFPKARGPRVRRVTRVVRHLDTWSIFKVAVVFNLVVYVVCLTAAVLLWNVAYSTGTIDNIENFFEQFGWESFDFRGGELYHSLWVAGLFVAVGLTGVAVLLATLFNLITDLVGGIRVTVLEEEVVSRPVSRSITRTRGATPNPPPTEQVTVAAPYDGIRPVDPSP